ncbi:transcriptional regulator with XRE-family HTH domain [Rhizobium sp. SG_E_25_P2]|uniref:LexA family transcriptional regulator n=1 Tax=Rhizobium sp. SG_E_25_P2 TaxID=2879942 RepID=UPI0024769AF8|nr:LexA family transcriptional regulator [Rhizobium sp. SG_E_25_P2]MDH6265513.1 transcriptional regulator with XRE-family HTH domain [Rhizobium sp. SG_E_25_P2]
MIEVLSRIEERLDALGISAASASQKAGLSKDAIRNIQRSVKSGKRVGVSTITLDKLAPVLKTTTSWLLNGVGDQEVFEPEGDFRRVVVAAHVQAGQWSESWEWPEDDQYPVYVPNDKLYAHVKLFGAETRGPSMNRRYPERTVLIFADVSETHEEPVPGKRYIVERCKPGGECEHTVKTLFVDEEGKPWLLPESDDPRYQSPISIEDGASDGDTIRIIGRVVFSVTRE